MQGPHQEAVKSTRTCGKGAPRGRGGRVFSRSGAEAGANEAPPEWDYLKKSTGPRGDPEGCGWISRAGARARWIGELEISRSVASR